MELTALCRAWAEAINADAALKEWATGIWKCPPAVWLGFDAVREFGREDAPYVVVQPLNDERGPGIEEQTVRLGIFLGCTAPAGNSGPVLTPEGLHILPEVELMEREFVPRVLDVLLRLSPPPVSYDGESLPSVDGFVEKYLAVSVSVATTLGMGRYLWR